MATLMAEAAKRLKLENAEDLARRELEARRDNPDDVINEIATMREGARTHSIPGAGD